MTEQTLSARAPVPAAALREQLLAAAPVQERTIEAAGIPTTLVEGGRGDPLLLLHGPGEHVLKWLPVLPALVATNRVIAPDLPGHGATGTPDGGVTTDRVLEWLGAVIEATCPSPPTLVGHIIGGAIAARYAADRGERIRRLVLVDMLGLVPFEPAPEFGAALGAYLASPDETSFHALMGRCAHDYDRLRAEGGETWEMIVAYTLDRVHAPGGLHALGTMMEHFGFPPIPPEILARIRVPVTLIWGRHDLATRLAVAEAASARYGWPLRVIEDCADDPVIEQPRRFVEALREG